MVLDFKVLGHRGLGLGGFMLSCGMIAAAAAPRHDCTTLCVFLVLYECTGMRAFVH